MKWSVIANDNINDFDDIGIDNYDYTTQEMVIVAYDIKVSILY